LTKEEAEAYMAEIADVELDEDALKQVAGGGCYGDTVVCRCEQCKCEQEYSVQLD